MGYGSVISSPYSLSHQEQDLILEPVTVHMGWWISIEIRATSVKNHLVHTKPEKDTNVHTHIHKSREYREAYTHRHRAES